MQFLESIKTGSWLTHERIQTYSLMIAIVFIAALGINWTTGTTPLTDRLGRPIGTDFSAFWTAGHMLLNGDFTGMFDPEKHFSYQSDIFGDPWVEHYGWHYPPPFLALAAIFASLSYVPAMMLWQATTLALYLRAVLTIAPRDPLVFMAAIGFPAVFVTMGHGHNAFLTTGLLGFGLYFLTSRPVLAGVCLGLLSYKPQFALVIPLVLVAGGHWRVIWAAAVTVIAMIVFSAVAFGPEAWQAFFKFSAFTKTVVLEQGGTGWFKIQSMFSAARSLGAPIAVAYVLQVLLTLGVMLTLVTMILARCDARLVAAATATATLLSTPYCLDYDMTILAVSIAFNVAYAAERGFAPYQKSLLVLLWATPLFARTGMQLTGIPIGLAVMCGYFAFLVHHALNGAETIIPQLRRLARG